MPRVAKEGDPVTVNHSCSQETTAEGKSSTVFADGKGVHCVGHLNADHKEPRSKCSEADDHQTGLIIATTHTVWADGKIIGQVGDPYGCNSEVAPNTNTVYVNG